MTFLNPLALLGLFAAGIPLLIHLFNFRKPKKVDFSSLSFLRELNKTAMKRVRIKQWLLLVLRMLALASLSLVFARPTVQSNLARFVGGDASSAVGIVIDNSRSMTLRGQRGEYFAQAKEVANQILAGLDNSDEIVLMTTNGESATAPAVFDNTPSAAQTVSDLEIADGIGNLTDAMRQIADRIASAGKPNAELYIITDGQASSVRDSIPVVSSNDNLNVLIAPIRSMQFENVAVTRVNIDSEIIEPGRPLRISATIHNFGDEDYDTYGSSVFIGENRVAQTTSVLPAGGTARAEYTFTPQRGGWLEGFVEMESDSYDADDRYHFSVFIPESYSVLLVKGDGSDTQYIDAALNARTDAAFDITRINEQRLPSSNLLGYQTVILAGVSSLSSGEIDNLASYIRQGGGVLLFPGPASKLAEHNALFAEIGGGALSPFIGRSSGPAITRLESVERDHPLFAGIFSRDDSDDSRVERPDVRYLADYQPRSSSEQTIATLGNGKPFVQEVRSGNGALIFCVVAPETSWSDLPVRGLFVPFVNRAVYYLSADVKKQGEVLIAGSTGSIALRGGARVTDLRIEGPSGVQYFPEARNTFGGISLLFNEGLDETGPYDVLETGSLVQQFNVNYPTEESDLRVHNIDDLKEVINTVLQTEPEVLDVAGFEPGEIAESVKTARTGVELWYAFLLISFILLIAEMLVAKAWRPEGSAVA